MKGGVIGDGKGGKEGRVKDQASGIDRVGVLLWFEW